MPVNEEFLVQLLQACVARAPDPLYPARFADEQQLDRDKLDVGLEELRRRGLLKLTDWVKDLGQGYALTDLGRHALASARLPTGRAVAYYAPAPQASPVSHYERGEAVRRAIFDPPPPRVIWILLAANLLYFAYGAVYAQREGFQIGDYLSGRSEATTHALINLGALHVDLVFPSRRIEPGARPEFERILLFLFLHIGLLHLGMNMYFLYALGQQIEGMWGWHRFLAIYFIAGIVSGCFVLMLSKSLTAGASGSMYGIFMAMVVFFWFNRQHLPERLIQDWSRNLATNAFLLVAINFVPFVSWQGHLGGAVGGLLAALLLQVHRFHPSTAMRTLALAGVPAIPIAFFLAVLWQAGWF